MEKFEATIDDVDIDGRYSHILCGLFREPQVYFLFGLVGPGSRDPAAPALQPGDVVEVVDGDLKNLTGKVVSLEGDSVTIKPQHKDLQVS